MTGPGRGKSAPASLRAQWDRIVTGALQDATLKAPAGDFAHKGGKTGVMHTEHLGHLLAWCIQGGMGVGDLLRMPFYHPVIEEALQAALYDLYAKVEARNPGPITELMPIV